MDERIDYRVNDGVAQVILNRADKRNALDWHSFKAIVAVQKAIAKDKRVRVVILSGAGEDFCSGLDVKSVMGKPKQALGLLAKWWPGRANLAQRVSTGWRALPVPVIAVLHGRTWGGGLQVALGADFRIAARDTDLSIMEGKWGLIPDMGGSLALRELMAADHALWLAMTAERLGAEKAAELGLVTEVCDDPMARAQSMADTLMDCSPDAVAAVKGLFRRHNLPGSGRLLAAETWRQCKVLMGRNQRIATARALGKARDYEPRRGW
ncbi:crotonase/enoyl-CoA hydratase family protein [Ferrimonas balearica]|uniref:crotonase/enoyl-CoA hydratase family protein n=1 Tax=Ferrimonas balearica TaxID=44012 RepID=UPI001F2288D2|nr:crotonase/enoyl-CoA hydratase family protein [Ferrimonas balearica]MBY6017973.1 crotonase/enoyl-CoA hydratase family protein [Halomonas denitrificans]MBY6094308.1 crotonase/enoyl-CoA hydratase family protein [Ferrimonas balearica]